MLSLVEWVGALGADLDRRCETCCRKLGGHNDGELLFCFSLYVGRKVAQSDGARRQLHRQVGRVQRAARRRK